MNSRYKPCEGCVDLMRAGAAYTCDYLLNNGKVRPCPPGEACTVKSTVKRSLITMNEGKRAWDTARAKELFAQGYSDLEIAEMVGTTKAAVGFWRHKNGLRRDRLPPGAEGKEAEPEQDESGAAGEADAGLGPDPLEDAGVSDPIVYRGDMPEEEYRELQDRAEKDGFYERLAEDAQAELDRAGRNMTAGTLRAILQMVPGDALVSMADSAGTHVTGCYIRTEYGADGRIKTAEACLMTD